MLSDFEKQRLVDKAEISRLVEENKQLRIQNDKLVTKLALEKLDCRINTEAADEYEHEIARLKEQIAGYLEQIATLKLSNSEYKELLQSQKNENLELKAQITALKDIIEENRDRLSRLNKRLALAYGISE